MFATTLATLCILTTIDVTGVTASVHDESAEAAMEAAIAASDDAVSIAGSVAEFARASAAKAAAAATAVKEAASAASDLAMVECSDVEVEGIRYKYISEESNDCFSGCIYVQEVTQNKFCFTIMNMTCLEPNGCDTSTRSGIKRDRSVRYRYGFGPEPETFTPPKSDSEPEPETSTPPKSDSEPEPETYTAPTSTTSPPTDKALFIAGGVNRQKRRSRSTSGNSVELWSPHQYIRCHLPALPGNVGMFSHTIDFVNGKLVICHRSLCIQLTQSGWSKVRDTLRPRSFHTSTVLGEDILLIGGYGSQGTSELLQVEEKKSELYFDLKHIGRRYHCAIKTGESTVVLTGGWGTEALVTEYSNLMVQNGEEESELPGLVTGRYLHACGRYHTKGDMILIVAGGQGDTTLHDLASTEVYNYSKRNMEKWKETSALPSARFGIRGANMYGVFYVSGGHVGTTYINQILAWDPNIMNWTLAGSMNTGRQYHAVTVVELSSLSEFCPT